MSFLETAEVPSLDNAGCSLTFGNACYVNLLANLENVGLDDIAYIESIDILESELLEKLSGSYICLGIMTLDGLINSLNLYFAEAQLYGVVAVGLNCLLLYDRAGTKLDNSYGDNVSFSSKSCVIPIFCL